MAHVSAWASYDPDKGRDVDEVPSSGYSDRQTLRPMDTQLNEPEPCEEHVARYLAMPHTCEGHHMQSANTMATEHGQVAQASMIGPAAQANPFPLMAEGASTTTDGPVTSGPFPSFTTPFLYANVVPPYWAPQVPWNYRQLFPLPMYDPPVAVNAAPSTTGAQIGDPSVIAYPGFITGENETSLFNPSTVAPQRQPQARSTRLSPIVPRPSDRVHVSIRTTPAGTMGCIGRGTRRRFDSRSLAKVNEVRQNGACLRCRIYKLSCTKEKPCTPCQNVSGNTKVHRGPCVNPRLDDVQAFRAGDGDNRTIVPTLPKLAWVTVDRNRQGGFRPVNQPRPRTTEEYPPSISIEVTWPFSADIVSEPPVARFDLHRFEPTGQYLAEEWTPLDGGPVCMVELPPLACRDTDQASIIIDAFLKECQNPLEQHISGMLKDSIMIATWKEVLRVRDQYRDPTLSRAVRIYATVLMNTRFPKSVRANIFDLAEEPEPPFFFEGNLLPPQFTYQIQMLIAMDQGRLQKEVIRVLKQIVFHKSRQEKWYNVFLVTFILLSCIELLHYNQTSYLHYKRQNSETNRENVSYVTRHMLSEWESSAENLISHFRFVMNGNKLFSQQGASFQKNMARASSFMDEGAVRYVMAMRSEVQRRMGGLAQARKSRKEGGERLDLWAVCELFLPDEEDMRAQTD